MLSILLIEYAAGQSKVYHVDNGRNFSDSHHNVVWLDISVDHASPVHELQPRDNLAEKHQAGLQRKLAAAEVEQVLQRRAEQLLDHEDEVVLDDNALMVQPWEAFAGQKLQVLKFHEQLREPTSNRLSFDGNLAIVVVLVVGKEHLTE